MWRWITLMLAVGTLAAGAHPAHGQTPGSPNIREVLTAASLTPGDVPDWLSLDQGRSGLRTGDDGLPNYTAAFVAQSVGELPIVSIVNTVGQDPDAATSIDRLADRFREGLGGNRTELPAPALGEVSRAFSTTRQVMPGLPAATTAFVAFRRGEVVASVSVAALGDTSYTDLALRLAQDVDRRLTTALGTAPETVGTSPTPAR